MASRSIGKTILLERDCDALLIPSAHPLTLPQGSAVRITQDLGGNFTVEVQGNLVLVMAEDRDALGMAPFSEGEVAAMLEDSGVSTQEKCWNQLHRCYDPEIPVDIVDLGLVYDLNVSNDAETAGKKLVYVTMTLTSPTCGMGPVIVEEVKRKTSAIPEVSQVTVELVFEPPWGREMMSDAAKLTLGLL